MKKPFLMLALLLTFSLTSGFKTVDAEDFGTCYVNITYTNSDGESWTESYYSNSRTSAADCAAGAQALASGNFMQSSDFRRSPVIFEM